MFLSVVNSTDFLNLFLTENIATFNRLIYNNKNIKKDKCKQYIIGEQTEQKLNFYSSVYGFR